MTDEMQSMASESAVAAFQKTYTMGNVYAQIAATIRQDFDDKDGKGWNCVVGKSFGAFVTHKIKTYIYFSVSSKPSACAVLVSQPLLSPTQQQKPSSNVPPDRVEMSAA